MRFNIKKRLNKELDSIVPPTLKIDGVTDAEFSLTTDGANVRLNGGKNLKITLTCVLLAIVLFLTCWFTIPLFAKKPLGKNVIVLEINPCVKVASDENGKVVSVVSGNSDGDVVLYDLRNEKLVGKTEEEVILILIDKAVELDFISDNREVNKINLSVLTENGSDALAKKLNASVLNYLTDNEIYGVVEDKTLSAKEYSEKFSQSFETVKEVFDYVASSPKFVYENEFSDGLTEEDFWLEYKNFLQEITLSYCNIIKQKSKDLSNIKTFVFSLEVLEKDAFSIESVDDIIIGKDAYNSFITAKNDFETKYGERLTKDRYDDLCNEYNSFTGVLTDIISTITSVCINSFDDFKKIAESVIESINDSTIKTKLESIFGELKIDGVTKKDFLKMKEYLLSARVEVNKQNASVYYNTRS